MKTKIAEIFNQLDDMTVLWLLAIIAVELAVISCQLSELLSR